MRVNPLNLAALAVLLASSAVAAHDLSERNTLEKRDYDSIKILNRKRNAHACIMSIVFLVLFPLGAISIHLPIDRIPVLRNTYLRRKVPAIHMPIQLLGLVMMIGGLALGIRIAHDLGFFNGPPPAHMVIGLLVTTILIAFQPLMGYLQHRFFKKHGKRSVFGHAHRWLGRGAIILGIINNGLGLQLAAVDIVVPNRSYLRNFIIGGLLVIIWGSLVAYDAFRPRRAVEPVGGKETAEGEPATAVDA